MSLKINTLKNLRCFLECELKKSGSLDPVPMVPWPHSLMASDGAIGDHVWLTLVLSVWY